MKSSLLVILITVFSIGAMAQTSDLKTDESLITSVQKINHKGYISKKVLVNAATLDIDEKGSKVVSFVFSYKDGDKFIESKNEGAQFSEMIKNRLKELKIGTKIYFDKIIIENASGTVLARPMYMTVKS